MYNNCYDNSRFLRSEQTKNEAPKVGLVLDVRAGWIDERITEKSEELSKELSRRLGAIEVEVEALSMRIEGEEVWKNQRIID